jgi:proline racemase
MVTSLANGQAPALRAATKAFTAKTTPKRDRTRPYTFTTKGKVTPPPTCAAGVTPTFGGDCLPLACPPGATTPTYCVGTVTCPPGVTDPQYCTPVPASALCTGKVKVTFKKSGTTISSRLATVQSDCTYTSRVSFKVRSRQRRGTLQVSVRFQGNSFLLPKSAPLQTVRAG